MTDYHDRAGGSPESTVPTGKPGDPTTPSDDEISLDDQAEAVLSKLLCVYEGREAGHIDDDAMEDLLSGIRKPVSAAYWLLSDEVRSAWLRRMRG